MIYTFAILLAPIPQIQLPGIRAQAIAYIQVGNLVAAVESGLNVEELKSSSEEILIQAVVSHDRLICQLFKHHALLPLRFGTAFISEQALQDYLTTQDQALSDRLQRLNGYAEYLVKATVTSQSSPDLQEGNLKGKDYLLAKRRQYLQQQEFQAQRQQEYQALLAIIQASGQNSLQVELATPQAGETLRAYVLATTAEIVNLKQTIQNLQIQFPHWSLEISDRLPIYHFADQT